MGIPEKASKLGCVGEGGSEAERVAVGAIPQKGSVQRWRKSKQNREREREISEKEEEEDTVGIL